MTPGSRLKDRAEIEVKDRWATELIFRDVSAWEAEWTSVQSMTDRLLLMRGTLGSGPDRLLSALELRDETESRLERLIVYASLRADEDTRVGENQALLTRARSLGVRYGEAAAWMAPELTALDPDTVESWMSEVLPLAGYRHYFDNLFRIRKYILPPREEELLAMAGEVRSTPATAYNLLKNADLTFPSIPDERGTPVELSDAAFYRFMRSDDRRVRKEAYEGIVGGYRGVRHTAAALLSGAVQDHLLNVRASGYATCLSAALDGGNIPVTVYDTLIHSVDEHLSLLHRYLDLRRRTLKLVDGVHAYDLFAPLISGRTYEVTFREAVETIAEALSPLGPGYVGALREGIAARWIDVYPTRGKRSGAYSSGCSLTQPFILLNFHGGYDDMSTLAHELGHSLHSHYSRTSQPWVYAEYDIFCAEVASTCNELLLQQHVLARTKDPGDRLFLLVEFLEGIRGSLFRQTMFSEFERRIHELAQEGEPLTADRLGDEYGRLVRRHNGPVFVHDELVNDYWIRIPHFYYNFYVYKYATSYCAAAHIADRVRQGDQDAVEAYLEFLRSGSSRYPVDLLRSAGVDLTRPEPYQAAMRRFEHLLDETERLIDVHQD